VKLCHVTPSAQVPTGVTLSAARRRALLDLADRVQMPVLEDDYECEVSGAAPRTAALAAQDGGDRVIYAGTFSKALFPGLRIGYVVGAPPLLRALALLRGVSTQQPSLLDQMALAELLARDSLERHVRRARKRYAERADAMAAALAASMPAGCRFAKPQGGTAFWVELPRTLDADSLAVAAASRGIVYAPGDAFRIDADGPPALVLSFATLAPDAIREGVAELARAVDARPARPTQRRSR
jgi:DNA-binding transcriptional MocR family regulator